MPEPVRHAFASDHDFVEEGRRRCGPGCELVVSDCACGLGKRERVLDGVVRAVEVRLSPVGTWHSPLDILGSELPFTLCPDCHEAGSGCASCNYLGVLKWLRPRHAGVALWGPVG